MSLSSSVYVKRLQNERFWDVGLWASHLSTLVKYMTLEFSGDARSLELIIRLNLECILDIYTYTFSWQGQDATWAAILD